jgi:hypothetical protein
VNLQETKVAMDDTLRSVECDVDVSEEKNCDLLSHGDQLENVLEEDEQRLIATQSPVIELKHDVAEEVGLHNIDVSGVKEGISEVVCETGDVHKNSAQDWRQLFRSEKSIGTLHYFAPSCEDGKIVVKPPKEAIEEGILKWSSSLVGQFLDKPLPYYIVKRTVENLWAQYGKVEVYLLENGLYLFRFADEKSRDEVMEAKIWHMANKPLILRRWSPGMQLLKLSLSSVPIWIKMHNLPIEFWNTTCLSYVASGIGKPLCADSVTEEQLRIGFARVLVEVSIDSDFPKEIEIVGVDGNRVVVGIEYPWIPVKCMKCKSFGHLAHTCTKVEKKLWIPKRPAPVHPKQDGVGIKKVAGNQVGIEPSVVNKEQWNVVKSARKTPVSKTLIKENERHWTNSFHLLARADGRYESGEERGSGPHFQSLQKVIEYALNEESDNLLKDKGKGKMGGEEEDLMRGFTPTE